MQFASAAQSDFARSFDSMDDHHIQQQRLVVGGGGSRAGVRLSKLDAFSGRSSDEILDLSSVGSANQSFLDSNSVSSKDVDWSADLGAALPGRPSSNRGGVRMSNFSHLQQLSLNDDCNALRR